MFCRREKCRLTLNNYIPKFKPVDGLVPLLQVGGAVWLGPFIIVPLKHSSANSSSSKLLNKGGFKGVPRY